MKPSLTIERVTAGSAAWETNSHMQRILTVDEDPDFQQWVSNHLENPNVEVETAGSASEAIARYTEFKPDLTITELHLKDLNGIELLKRIRQTDPNAMVILSSGFPRTSAVIESMKLGAYDFLRKESLQYELRRVVEGALKARDEVNSTDRQEAAPELTFDQKQESIIGKSAAMQDVFKMIGRVSRADAPVMITGESGSGKEIVARAIHKFSPRAQRDFVAINCAAIPDNLLESELFGHEKGSFTGAASRRIGRFEQCDGGTLFMDEIGDMPMQVQSKILRVLQEGEFSRVGGNETLKTDVRILAATNKTLEHEVEQDNFREDLFYRLNVVRIHIPPLRQRPEDIPLLAEYFLQKIANQRSMARLRLSDEALNVLRGYDWPGNVRELENTMQRACVLATADVLLPRDIPLGKVPRRETTAEGGSKAEISVEQAVQRLLQAAQEDSDLQLLPWLEREMTLHAMKETNGNQVQASKLLGITRATLRKRLERYDLANSE